MNPQDPEQDPLAIYLIINGSLGLSAGKIASQTFQAAQRLLAAAGDASPEQREALARWQASGTRTITKIAPTAELFARCQRDIPGITMVDEGVYGCEPDSQTCLASWPILRSQLPSALKHKRIRLMSNPCGCSPEHALA